MTSQLARRIAVTLGVLFVYRLGTYIPLPGVDVATWTQIMTRQSGGGILAMVNQMSGGAIGRLSIFSITVVPYFTAALFVQLAIMVSRRLRAIRDQGERGRQRIERTTRIVTVIIAAFQAYGIAGGLEGTHGVVVNPGALFTLTTVLTLTGGVLVLVWLAEQITMRGIGNGLALILFVGFASELPRDVAGTIELTRMGVFSSATAFGLLALQVAIVALVVTLERARRRLPVRFAARDVGGRQIPEQSAEIVYKLNPAGILPMSIALLVLTVALITLGLAVLILGIGARIEPLVAALTPGTISHLVLITALILFFVFLYTAFVCDPTDAAETLKSHGGVIADVAPGEPTAAYLDGVLSRTALIGAVYLVAMILMPEIFQMIIQTPYPIGGISVLILVCVTLDIEGEIRGYLARPASA